MTADAAAQLRRPDSGGVAAGAGSENNNIDVHR